jgi:hypothetical protein
MQARILLRILELDDIPNFEFVQPLRVDFQDVPGWLARSIGWMPGARKDGVHDNLLGIDPDDGQVHENEKHVDGSIETTVARFDQQQTFVCVEAGTEHQATQTAHETVAEGDIQR